MIKTLIVRFLKLTYKNEVDKFDDAKYLAGFMASGNFDNYAKMFITMKDCDIEIGDEWYIIDDVVFSFGTEEGSAPCLNVYLI